MRINNVYYQDYMLELMMLAYDYGWEYTKQYEKFSGDPKNYNIPGGILEKQWEDRECAYKLLKEELGREFVYTMLDYIKEIRQGNK